MLSFTAYANDCFSIHNFKSFDLIFQVEKQFSAINACIFDFVQAVFHKHVSEASLFSFLIRQTDQDIKTYDISN